MCVKPGAAPACRDEKRQRLFLVAVVSGSSGRWPWDRRAGTMVMFQASRGC